VQRLRDAPVALFLELMREAGVPLTASALKARLRERGGAKPDVDAAWRRAQPTLRRAARFDPATRTYAWVDGPPVPSPRPALDELLSPRVDATRRLFLAEAVRAALTERDDLESRLRQAYSAAQADRATHERRARADGARALARVAMELEELAAAGARPWVMIERIRALIRMWDLEPIGRAGEQIAYDPARHAAVAGAPPPGTPVGVVRPGYVWRSGDRDILLDRALVAPL